MVHARAHPHGSACARPCRRCCAGRPASCRAPAGCSPGWRCCRCCSACRASFPLVSVYPLARCWPAAPRSSLCGSWIYGFLRQRVPFGLEVLDAVALTAFALAGPVPAAATPLIFASAWLRTLYGRRGARCARGALLHGRARGHHRALAAVPRARPRRPTCPTGSAWCRSCCSPSWCPGSCAPGCRPTTGPSNATRRSPRPARSCSGITDAARIRALAWTTANELGSTTPGLRVLKVVRDGERAAVGAHTGVFIDPPDHAARRCAAQQRPRREAPIAAPGPTQRRGRQRSGLGVRAAHRAEGGRLAAGRCAQTDPRGHRPVGAQPGATR